MTIFHIITINIIIIGDFERQPPAKRCISSPAHSVTTGHAQLLGQEGKSFTIMLKRFEGKSFIKMLKRYPSSALLEIP